MLIVNKKYREACFLTGDGINGDSCTCFEEDDNAILRRLRDEAAKYQPEEHEGKSMECRLMFAESSSLWQVLTLGMPTEISEKVDVMVTTQEDMMAKELLVNLPGHTSGYPMLDRLPQGYNSDKRVHLVIFGSTRMAEALAINAAFVAHYPNYCRDKSLRTRITIIDQDVISLRDRLLQQYQHLFDHSYHRTLDLYDSNPQCALHRPMYEGRREDFVDIEWEFVKAGVGNDAVRQKLSEWASSDGQQLTVAICGADLNQNAVTALTMPEELKRFGIPVLFQSAENPGFNYADRENIYPFSIEICRQDSLHTLKQMAMRVNYVYNHCFALPPDAPITAPTDIDKVEMERQWDRLSSFGKRYANVLNAMMLATKMHSVGLTAEDWQSYYALSREEIDILSEVEHNRWSVGTLILGFRPVTDEEQAAVEKDISLKRKLRDQKIHYDLRAFDDLRNDVTGKNVDVYDKALTQGIPLILKTCITD